MTSEKLTSLFADLGTRLVPLVESLRGAPRPSLRILEREFPLDHQRSFSEGIAPALASIFKADALTWGLTRFVPSSVHGRHAYRLAVSGAQFRERISRRHARDRTRTLRAGTRHRALRNADWRCGIARHPRVSIAAVGNLVGRCRGFWLHFYPKLQAAFNESLSDVSLEEFRGVMNDVSPGLIRVEADEVTYNLHIVIRFELERALLSGDLRAADFLPPGLRRISDTSASLRRRPFGCLQDIHWSEGLIAYFPTYTLGNVYAAQLFEAAGRALGPLEDAFARRIPSPAGVAARKHSPSRQALPRDSSDRARNRNRS